MSVELELRIIEADGSNEDLEVETRTLRADVLCIDGVIDVSSVKNSTAPAQTRSGVVEEIGSLLVMGKAAVDLAGPVSSIVRQWTKAGRESATRSATLSIDGKQISLSGNSAENEDKLVNAWLDSVATSESSKKTEMP